MKLIIFAFSLFSFLSGNSQHLYERLYQDGAVYGAYDIKPTSDRNYILTGYSNVTNSIGGLDLWVMKIDSLGDVLWANRFGNFSGADDQGERIIETIDSGFVICGRTDDLSGSGNGSDSYLIKLDKNGNLLWEQTWSYPDFDVIMDVVEIPSDSGLLCVGYRHSHIKLTRTDKFGDSLWTKSFEQDSAVLMGVAITGNEQFIAVGSDADGNPASPYGLVVKYDELGNQIWRTNFFGNGGEFLRDVLITDDGFVYTVGNTALINGSTNDGILRKLDASGNHLWYETFGTPSDDNFFGMTQGNEVDEVGMLGSTYRITPQNPNGTYYFYFVQSKNDGAEFEELLFGADDTDNKGYSLCQGHDGGYVLCGSYSIGGNNVGCQIIKVNEQGSLVSVNEVTIPTFNVNAYPNPVSDYLNVTWDDNLGSETTISLINAQGQLVFQDQITHSDTFQIDCNPFAKGIYLLQVKQGKTSISSRIVVQ